MSERAPKVDILLGTFVSDGKDEIIGYLRQQLDSLVAQDYPNYRILIRDDGSTHPGVLKVLEEYKQAHPGLIKIIKDNDGNLSYGGNFERLMEHSDAPYAMFCDQDDIWHSNKLSHSVKQLQAQEAEHGADTPILVHHNARIIDQEGHVHFQRMEDNWGEDFNVSSSKRAITANPVLGCTMVINRALIEKSLPFPDAAKGAPRKTVGHDGHIYAVAQLLGKIFYNDEPLFDYRIHTDNTSQAVLKESGQKPKKMSWWNLADKFNRLSEFTFIHRMRTQRAKDFLSQYGDDPAFKPEDKKMVEAFAGLGGFFNYRQRWLALKQYGFYQNNGRAAKMIATFLP